jgi:hypothetical protein
MVIIKIEKPIAPMQTHLKILLGRIISAAVFLLLTTRVLHAGTAYIDTDPPWQLDSSGNKVVVIEKGDTVDFTLHASDDDNGFLGNYKWSITNGNVTSNITGMTADVTYGASADGSDNGVSVSLVHDDSLNPNITCTNGTVDSVTVRVVKLDVMEVSYGDDGDGSNVRMIDTGSTYASTSGTSIQTPEWTSGGADNATCYIQGGSPELTVKFSVSPPMTDANISADATVSGNFQISSNTGYNLGSVSFDEQDIDLTDVGSNVTQVFDTEDSLPAYVARAAFNGTFNYYINDGDPTLNMASHPTNEVCLIYGTPDPNITPAKIRFEYWCGNIYSETDEVTVVDKVGPIATSYPIYVLSSPLTGEAVWSILDGANSDCAAQARLMNATLRLIGIDDGDTVYVYPQSVSWGNLVIWESASPWGAEYSYWGQQDPGNVGCLLAYGAPNTSGSYNVNFFEGCYRYVEGDPPSGYYEYWMGGTSSCAGSAYDALTDVCPNNSSVWQFYIDETVPPALPPKKNFPASPPYN